MLDYSASEGEMGEHDLAEVEEQGARVKIEDGIRAWVSPLYADEPTLVFDGRPVSRKTFETVYGLSNKGKSPKKLKIGRDCTEAEVERWFGPVNGKNAYHYPHHDDEETCKEIEKLWMICHQKTVVPGVRTINKAEARGFTCMKKQPPVLVNWAVFGEWCIRDRIRREERVAKKQFAEVCHFVPVHLDSEDDNPKSGTRSLERPRRDELKHGRQVLDRPLLRTVNRQDHASLILEWTSLLTALDEEVLALSLSLELLKGNKDQSTLELVRADAQLVDRRELLRTASQKLQQFEVEVTAMKASAPDASLVNWESFPGADKLRRQLDAQSGVLDTFVEMLATGEVDHEKARGNAIFASRAESIALVKFEVLCQQKEAVKAQLRVLKAGRDLPNPLPRPRQSGSADSKGDGNTDCCLLSDPCTFCGKGFWPEWDCKIASCRHGYHSWCANAHFSNSTRCCLKECDLEMHSSWWLQSGYKPIKVGKEAGKIVGEAGKSSGEERETNGVARKPVASELASTVSDEEERERCAWIPSQRLQAPPASTSGTISLSIGSKGSGMRRPLKELVSPTALGKKRKEVDAVKKGGSLVQLDLEGKRRRFPVKKGLETTSEEFVVELGGLGISKGASAGESYDASESGSEFGSEAAEDDGAPAVCKKLSGSSRKNVAASPSCTGEADAVVARENGKVVRKSATKEKKMKTPVHERVSMARTTRPGNRKGKSCT